MNLNLLVSLEVFLLTMLAVIIWNNQTLKFLPECSRHRSHIVREILTKKFMPIFGEHHTPIPLDCPFHPDRDCLWWPPTANTSSGDQVDIALECPVCSLRLPTPEAVIDHWDENHRFAIRDTRDDLICLADYCDIFRCDVLLAKRLASERSQSYQYYHLLDFFIGQSGEDSGEGAPIERECRPERMIELESTCRSIVHQCTIAPTTSSTSSQANLSTTSNRARDHEHQLAMVEKALGEMVCMYLTCEHYHDDILNNQHESSYQAPFTLFVIVGLVMLGGFALCYYVIWTSWFGQQLHNKNLQQSFGSLLSPSHHQAHHHSSSQPILNACASKTKSFLRNLFEFNCELKDEDLDEEDGKEYANSDGSNKTQDYDKRKKLHRISSIIEEEDDEVTRGGNRPDDEGSEASEHHSYPMGDRKRSLKRRAASTEEANSHNRLHWTALFNNLQRASSSDNQFKAPGSSHSSPATSKQEIFVQDPPLQINWKFVQPRKLHDRLQCFSVPVRGASEPEPDLSMRPVLPKARSYSHSQLRTTPGYARNEMGSTRSYSPHPPLAPSLRSARQDSIEEEWIDDDEEELESIRSQPHSHSSMSVRTSQSLMGPHHYGRVPGSAAAAIEPNGGVMLARRPLMRELYTKSSMSYNEALHSGRATTRTDSASSSSAGPYRRPRSQSHQPPVYQYQTQSQSQPHHSHLYQQHQSSPVHSNQQQHQYSAPPPQAYHHHPEGLYGQHAPVFSAVPPSTASNASITSNRHSAPASRQAYGKR